MVKFVIFLQKFSGCHFVAERTTTFCGHPANRSRATIRRDGKIRLITNTNWTDRVSKTTVDEKDVRLVFHPPRRIGDHFDPEKRQDVKIS